jgi:hypothetical protein
MNIHQYMRMYTMAGIDVIAQGGEFHRNPQRCTELTTTSLEVMITAKCANSQPNNSTIQQVDGYVYIHVQCYIHVGLICALFQICVVQHEQVTEIDQLEIGPNLQQISGTDEWYQNKMDPPQL